MISLVACLEIGAGTDDRFIGDEPWQFHSKAELDAADARIGNRFFFKSSTRPAWVRAGTLTVYARAVELVDDGRDIDEAVEWLKWSIVDAERDSRQRPREFSPYPHLARAFPKQGWLENAAKTLRRQGALRADDERAYAADIAQIHEIQDREPMQERLRPCIAIYDRLSSDESDSELGKVGDGGLARLAATVSELGSGGEIEGERVPFAAQAPPTGYWARFLKERSSSRRVVAAYCFCVATSIGPSLTNVRAVSASCCWWISRTRATWKYGTTVAPCACCPCARSDESRMRVPRRETRPRGRFGRSARRVR